MTEREDDERSATRSRRAVLGSLGAGGAIAVAGCLGDDEEETPEGETTEQDVDGVQFGISVPESGIWANEGEQLRRGYELAAQHINAGNGAIVDGPWDSLTDGGVLGEDITLVVEDTQSDQEGARESATALADEGVEMIAGGASGPEGIAHQRVATEQELVYMSGYTPSGAVSGRECSAFGFNELYTPQLLVPAVASVLAAEFGADANVNFTQLYPDTDDGEELFRTVQAAFEGIGDGWIQQPAESTRSGTRTFTSQVETIVERSPDMVVLDYYGFEAQRALEELRNQAGEDIAVVVPVFNWTFAQNAGSDLAGVYGAVHWSPTREDSFSQRLVETWSDLDTATDVPSPTAHLAYVQLCQYAAAVQRADTFDAPAVVDELEEYTYDLGAGQQRLRPCDHQSVRNVLVAQGLPAAEQSSDRYYEVVEQFDGDPYSCDDPPASNCAIQSS